MICELRSDSKRPASRDLCFFGGGIFYIWVFGPLEGFSSFNMRITQEAPEEAVC
ncbi:hypothetical protein BO79DRAFT_56258 [Aspergillus costaricaensis CBS 115574]|uniref:Uncharacterized protein n=1 Tax=Aspergillus costaricaensis CBS 115574 TaxID=1448317 RepID=A0ACD1IR21_9EURO|nr:hypothetical protein BO79DRAFT_56258 [Aspergillus costaricaensis CBS 115574]RAK92774.1 hypothetical protein BO79DRAFT_56258 [Aspergillus costaricaensis CBS 115574]